MSQDLEQLAPDLFALARQLRDQSGGKARLRCIRIGVDENGDGGEVVAGAWPDEPLRRGEVEVNYKLRHPVEPIAEVEPIKAQVYRGKPR